MDRKGKGHGRWLVTELDGEPLSSLLAEIAACRACADDLPHEPRPVVMVGPQTQILICGQAPGRRVHESGRPFTDPSGDRLRQWMGVDEATFYDSGKIGVAAMAFCFPGTDPKGGDYPPPPRCAKLWREPLMTALPPMEVTLVIGSYAQAWTFRDRTKPTMTETVRAWRDYAPTHLPMPHPSWRNTGWLKKSPWFDEEIVPYLRQRVADILGS